MKEQQNFLAAIVLSLAVLLGWQFFVVEPRMAAERAQRLAAAQSEEAALHKTARIWLRRWKMRRKPTG